VDFIHGIIAQVATVWLKPSASKSFVSRILIW